MQLVVPDLDARSPAAIRQIATFGSTAQRVLCLSPPLCSTVNNTFPFLANASTNEIVKEMSTLTNSEQEALGRLCRILGRKERS